MRTLSTCPVCDTGNIKFAFKAPTTRGMDDRQWTASECNECDHQFMNPQPSWDDLAPYYDTGYAAYSSNHGTERGDEEAVQKARQTGKLRYIPLPTGKRVLDAGCGAGAYLRIAKRLGIECEGVEPSPYAANVARDQGLKVFNGTIEEFANSAPEKFDVITSHHVLEHVPAPVETFSALKQLLAPGGYIWIAVPNAAYPPARAIKGMWHASDLPYHLMQFSPKSLQHAGEQAGLTARKVSSHSIPHLVEASLSQYLRFRWMLPRRLTQKTGLMKPLANQYAKYIDSKSMGEAIFIEFEHRR